MRHERNGLSFECPDDWQVEPLNGDDYWGFDLISDGTGTVQFLFYAEEIDPADVLEQAIESFRVEYPKLEAQQVVQSIAGVPALGYDAEFFDLDLTNTLNLRVLGTEEGVLVIMITYTDADAEEFQPVMQSIIRSITIE